MVGLALEQIADTVELAVREAEGAVQLLLEDPRQGPESRDLRGRLERWALRTCPSG